jgi:hypothetical protein
MESRAFEKARDEYLEGAGFTPHLLPYSIVLMNI